MNQQNSLIDDILRIPWRAGIMSAIGIFFVLQLLLRIVPPGLDDGSFLLVIQSVGSVFCVLLLFAALLSFLGEKIRYRRYKKPHRRSGFHARAQKSPDSMASW